RLVCRAISSMTPMISAILRELSSIRAIASTACATTVPPRSATSRVPAAPREVRPILSQSSASATILSISPLALGMRSRTTFMSETNCFIESLSSAMFEGLRKLHLRRTRVADCHHRTVVEPDHERARIRDEVHAIDSDGHREQHDDTEGDQQLVSDGHGCSRRSAREFQSVTFSDIFMLGCMPPIIWPSPLWSQVTG